MNHEEFLKFVDETNEKCKVILNKKKRHRETVDDRMLQFRIGASLRQRSMVSAVADQMLKHTTQLYAMVKEHEDGIPIDPPTWEETIYDNINYQHLMLAALKEFFTMDLEPVTSG